MKNTQANYILERIDQAIENLVRTFYLKNNYLEKEDPWAGILADTYFAVQSTYIITLQATPLQIVSVHDMILNTSLISEWGIFRRD